MWPFRRKTEPAEPVPFFDKPARQLIFKYWDGTRWRNGDPLRLLKELTSDQATNLEVDYRIANEECKETLNASCRVADAVRKAFSVPSVDNGGLTDAFCGDLLDKFMEFVLHVKKNSPSGPTQLPPTIFPSTPADSVTSNGAASSSTAAVNSTMPPAPSASESS